MDSSELSVIPDEDEKARIIAAEGSRILVVDDGASRTEIDLHDRVIRKRSKLMGFAYSRACELDSQAAVCIKDESTIIEGYPMTSFAVYLISGGRKLRISSTNGQKAARHLQSRITDFLKKAGPLPSEGE